MGRVIKHCPFQHREVLVWGMLGIGPGTSKRRLTMKYLVMALAFALAYIVVAEFVFAVPFDMVH